MLSDKRVRALALDLAGRIHANGGMAPEETRGFLQRRLRSILDEAAASARLMIRDASRARIRMRAEAAEAKDELAAGLGGAA